jgi:hypothetical protein
MSSKQMSINSIKLFNVVELFNKWTRKTAFFVVWYLNIANETIWTSQTVGALIMRESVFTIETNHERSLSPVSQIFNNVIFREIRVDSLKFKYLFHFYTKLNRRITFRVHTFYPTRPTLTYLHKWFNFTGIVHLHSYYASILHCYLLNARKPLKTSFKETLKQYPVGKLQWYVSHFTIFCS